MEYVALLMIVAVLLMWRRLPRHRPENDDLGLFGSLIDGSPQVAGELPLALAAAIRELQKIPRPETARAADELRYFLGKAVKSDPSIPAWLGELAVELRYNLPTNIADWQRQGLISLNEKERLIEVLGEVLTCVREVLHQEWLASGGHRAEPTQFLNP